MNVPSLRTLFIDFYKQTDPQLHNYLDQMIEDRLSTVGGLFELLDILLMTEITEENFFLKKAASINIRLSVIKNFDELKEKKLLNEIKIKFLELFQVISDQYLLSNIVKSMDKLLKNFQIWPEIYDLTADLIVNSNNDSNKLRLGLNLLSEILSENKDENELTEYSMSLFDYVGELLKKNDELFDILCIVVSRYFTSGVFENNVNLSHLTILFQILPSYLDEKNQNFSLIFQTLELIFDSDVMFEDIGEYIRTLLQITNSGLSICIKSNSFIILSRILANDNNRYSIDDDLIIEIFNSVIQFSILGFNDSFYDDQENLGVVSEVIFSMMIGCEDKSIVLGAIFDPISNFSDFAPPHLYTFSSILINIVDQASGLISKSQYILSFDVSFFCLQFSCESPEQTICVREAGFELMKVIVLNSPKVLVIEKQGQIIQSSINNLHVGTSLPSLFIRLFSVLEELLNSISISSEYHEVIFSTLKESIESLDPMCYPSILRCISSLIKSIPKEIRKFMRDIISIAQRAVQYESPGSVQTRCIGCFILSQSFSYIGNKKELYELFLKFASSDDIDQISSGLKSFKSALKTAVPVSEEYFSAALNIAIHTIENKIEQGEECVSYNNSIYVLYDASFGLITSISKSNPDLVLRSVDKINEIILSFIQRNSTSDKILHSALKTCGALITVSNNFDTYSDAFIDIVNNGPSSQTLTSLFGAFLYIANNLDLASNIIDFMTLVALNTFRHQVLDYDDGYDEDVFSAVTQFLSLVATKYTQAYPLSEVLDLIKKKKKDELSEASDLFLTLTDFIVKSHQTIEFLRLKQLVSLYINSIGMCDFSVFPSPISGIRSFIDIVPNIFQNSVGELIEACHVILVADETDDTFCIMTKQYASSLLFTIWRRIMKQDFNFTNLLPLMLKPLPPHDDEAENIFECIVLMFNTPDPPVVPYIPHVLLVLAKFLSFPQDIYKFVTISDGVFVSIAVLFQKLFEMTENAEKLLDENISDQELINQRLEDAADIMDELQGTVN